MDAIRLRPLTALAGRQTDQRSRQGKRPTASAPEAGQTTAARRELGLVADEKLAAER